MALQISVSFIFCCDAHIAVAGCAAQVAKMMEWHRKALHGLLQFFSQYRIKSFATHVLFGRLSRQCSSYSDIKL